MSDDREPHASGRLEVGDGHRIYWEICGNPDGKPAVVLHGGPGSGCSPRYRDWFDPAAYRIVLFDQRNSGRSTPYAGEPVVDLSTNTTAHLIADIERLREHLAIDRWLVAGISWGTTLGLAYAEEHPERVTELVLNSTVISSRAEVEWLTRRRRPGATGRTPTSGPTRDTSQTRATRTRGSGCASRGW
jgi:proline iminopeptidase